jgi:hypothetical protein
LIYAGGEISEPQEEILAIIEICRSAIAVPKKSRPSIEAQTIGAVRSILVKLRECGATDATLATIMPSNSRLNWWDVLSAMEAAKKFLEGRLARD